MTRKHDTAARTRATEAAIVLALVAAAVAASLSTLRLGLPLTDEGAILTGAVKLLRGGIFFRDVDAFPLPGAWYLAAAVMALFGESLLTARVLDVLIYTAMVVVSYLAVRKVIGRFPAALYGVSLIALKWWTWPVWTAYFYHDLAVMLSMAGMLAFLRSLQGAERWPLFVAGFLFGAATMCKQTTGIYPGLVGFGLVAARGALAARGAPVWSRQLLRSDSAGRQPLRALAYYAAGGVIALGIPFAYFAAHGLGMTMVTNALVRPFTNYLPLSKLPYTVMLKVWEFGHMGPGLQFSYIPQAFIYSYRLPLTILGSPVEPGLAGEAVARAIYVLIPLAFVTAAALLGRGLLAPRRRDLRTAGALALYALAGAMFLSAFPRADFAHVANVGPAWLAVAFLAGELLMRAAGATRWRRRLVGAAMALATATAFGSGIILLASVHRNCSASIELPRLGRMWVWPQHDQLATVVKFIRSHTQPGDPLFVLGSEAYYYFLCDRYSPWRFPQLYPGQTGDYAGRQVVEAIEKAHVRYVIHRNMDFGGLPPLSSYAPSIVIYVQAHYRREVELGSAVLFPGTGDTILERADQDPGVNP